MEWMKKIFLLCVVSLCIFDEIFVNVFFKKYSVKTNIKLFTSSNSYGKSQWNFEEPTFRRLPTNAFSRFIIKVGKCGFLLVMMLDYFKASSQRPNTTSDSTPERRNDSAVPPHFFDRSEIELVKRFKISSGK